MNKKIFFFALLILVLFVSVPIFSGVSLDVGVSTLGNAVDIATRPLGVFASIGVPMFDYLAIVQAMGSVFSPSPGEDSSDPVGVLSAGVLFSPMKYLYLGMRTILITPPDDATNPLTYGSMVLRVQNPGKGTHFFAETEISFTGMFNRFTTGINFTF